MPPLQERTLFFCGFLQVTPSSRSRTFDRLFELTPPVSFKCLQPRIRSCLRNYGDTRTQLGVVKTQIMIEYLLKTLTNWFKNGRALPPRAPPPPTSLPMLKKSRCGRGQKINLWTENRLRSRRAPLAYSIRQKKPNQLVSNDFKVFLIFKESNMVQRKTLGCAWSLETFSSFELWKSKVCSRWLRMMISY